MMMCNDAILEKMILHRVGNKANGELLTLSQDPFLLNNDIAHILLQYFVQPFKSPQYYVFSNDKGLDFNTMYASVSKIFDNPKDELYSQSVNMAQHLYDVSLHPNI